MDYSLLIPATVALSVAAGVWALISAFSPAETRASARLDELKDPKKRALELTGGSNKDGMSGAFKKAAPSLSKALKPTTELDESKLKIKLANAGFSSFNAPTIFLAIKMAVAVGGFLLGGGLGLIFKGLSADALIASAAGFGLGLFIPDVTLSLMAWSRKDKIFLSLPDALDLLVVCVEAGLGLDAAMRRVAEELTDGAPEICQEINHCNLQLQMGRNRREVLHDFGIRTGVDDVRALAAIMIQADKFGSSVAQALRVQSDTMRIKRSQMAEEKAAATAVKMIFPLVLFIFPGIFVILVGPAAIMMIRQLLTT